MTLDDVIYDDAALDSLPNHQSKRLIKIAIFSRHEFMSCVAGFVIDAEKQWDLV